MLRCLKVLLGLSHQPRPSSGIPFVFCLGFLLVLQGCQQAEETIRAGETAVFEIDLEKGQFQAILLKQLNGDLSMTLVPPVGNTLRVDYFYGTNIEEKLFWRAEETGKYKLTVTPLSKKSGFSLRYKLAIQPPRLPTPQDLDRLEAQRLYEEASRLADKPQPNDQELGRQHDLTANTYRESAAKWRAAGEPDLSIVTLIRLGQSFHHDDAERSKSYFEQALQEALRSMNIRGQAEAYSNLGSAYNDLSKSWSDKQQARQFLDEALKLSLQAGDQRVAASTLSNLGIHYFSIGEYQPAAEHFLRSLEGMRQLGDQDEEALVLVNLGAAYFSMGLKPEAEKAFGEALQIARVLGNTLQQARALNGLGRVRNALGDGSLKEKGEAKKSFEQAVALGGKTRNQQTFKQNLGAVCYELGEMHARLGEQDKSRDNFNQALSNLRESLSLQQEQGGSKTNSTLTFLGLLYYARGDIPEASRLLQKALESCRIAKDEYQEATVLAAQARMARDRNDLAEAKESIDKALKLVGALGLRIKAPEWRSSYATSQQHFYDLQIDILLRLYSQRPSGSYHKVAWQKMEESRRNTLREVLDALGVSFSNGVDPRLIEERKAVRIGMTSISQTQSPPDLADQLTTRYREIEKQIRQQNKRYDELLYTTINAESLTELQQKVLKKDTILLEYALGQDRSYLWAITPTTFEVFTLPARIQLESAAGEVRQAMIDEKGEATAGDKQVGAVKERRVRLKGSELEYHRAATRLSNMLLGPVASRLEKKRLLIVGDGILGRIPFAALPVPAPDPDTGFRLLLHDHEIAYAPSAMTLLALYRERSAAKKGTGSAVIIADPVFNLKHRQASSLCRYRRSTPAPLSPAPILLVDPLADLDPVPFDNAEKTEFREAVFGQSPPSSRKELFEFLATRGNVIDGRLAQDDDIVFYTHGIFSEGEQGMIGLALSRLNENCEVQDYLLKLDDIYDLRLSADLVTLIACSTTRNQRMRGFGIGSIAHGFMFAGASRVLGTLWDVDGPASLKLATRFYRNRRAGRSAAEALRTAQLSLLNDSQANWRLPYYWAGFVLMGDVD